MDLACQPTPASASHRSAEAIIEIVVKSTAAQSGQDFFESLVKSIALALNVRHCLMTELLKTGQLRTLAFWQDGKIAPNITYDPAPGPCGVVLAQDIYYCASGVQQLFPHQPALPMLEAESYVGVSLRDRQGKILGNFAVLDSQPILAQKLHEDILRIFADRASAELERQHALTALQALNEDLEHRVEQRTMELAQQTERLQQTLQELKQTQTTLIQTAKMTALGQLVSGVAHEINNPVSFIHGNLIHAVQYTQDLLKVARLYQQDHPTPSSQIAAQLAEIDVGYIAQDLLDLFQSMETGTKRIREITHSLRTFSRLDEAAYKTVDLHENLDSILLLLGEKLHHRGGDTPAIQVIKEYGVIPSVTCYASQLNQVFMSLLCNAIDALNARDTQRLNLEMIQSPSRIWITTHKSQSDQVVIRVADNGIGISEADLLHIFDPFFTTKPVGQGTGMGLSISYQIVTEQHLGRLECHSEPGKGAEFIITLPVHQNQ
ncbi:MAG: ATPase [Plectolyngbya sp. WJT66-NPBG17]|jgi:signal transduction histidine kinase|nr:ATPase [Plectolyngbya sp. WJT66-NPBG17]